MQFSQIFPLMVASFIFRNLYVGQLLTLGLDKITTTITNFFLKMRHFSDLAFVPSRDVPEVFEELSGDDMMPQEFLSYYEFTYIGIERGTRNNRRTATPMFPIRFWNVYSCVVNSLPRINSDFEAFHIVLNKSVSNSLPNI